MLRKEMKKVIAGTMLGLSLLTVSGGSTEGLLGPVAVEAAVVKPVINVTGSTISVYRGTNMELYANVVKSIKKGTYPVKSVKFQTIKASNGKRISHKAASTVHGKVPAKVLSFKNAGTYAIKLTATDTKGNKTVKSVKFKVSKTTLDKKVKGIVKNNYQIKKGSKPVNFSSKCTFSKSIIKSVKANASGIDYDKAGSYKLYYNITGVNGQKCKVARTVKVVAPKPAPSVKPDPSDNAENLKPCTLPEGATVLGNRSLLGYVADGIETLYVAMGTVNLDTGANFKLKDSKYSSIVDLESPKYSFPKDPTFKPGSWAYGEYSLQYKIYKGNDYCFINNVKMYVIDNMTAQDLANRGAKIINGYNPTKKCYTYVQPEEDSPVVMGLEKNPHRELVSISEFLICKDCLFNIPYEGVDGYTIGDHRGEGCRGATITVDCDLSFYIDVLY